MSFWRSSYGRLEVRRKLSACWLIRLWFRFASSSSGVVGGFCAWGAYGRGDCVAGPGLWASSPRGLYGGGGCFVEERMSLVTIVLARVDGRRDGRPSLAKIRALALHQTISSPLACEASQSSDISHLYSIRSHSCHSGTTPARLSASSNHLAEHLPTSESS